MVADHSSRIQSVKKEMTAQLKERRERRKWNQMGQPTAYPKRSFVYGAIRTATCLPEPYLPCKAL